MKGERHRDTDSLSMAILFSLMAWYCSDSNPCMAKPTYACSSSS